MADDKEKCDSEKSTTPGDSTIAKEDEELSALLDSALADLTTEGSKKGPSQDNTEVVQTVRPDHVNPPDTLWNEEFLRQATARLEHNMQSLFSPGVDGTFSPEQLGENIQRLAEAATTAVGGETSPDAEFSHIIAQTLKNLSENTENIQNQLNDDDLMNMLGSLGQLSDPNADPGELLPFMQQMMQSLLSKDILYPALSSIIEKYPDWLNSNKDKISNSEFERYSEQLKLMRQVCSELDKESSTDSSQVKNARFEIILGLMQKMQDCGQPPAELAGDLGPILSVDENGLPQLPGNLGSQQCCLQ